MDSSIYGALVRLSQPWVMRYPLIDFHGSNGNRDGDGPAAYRYTEARLSKLAEEGMLAGIKKKNVDFIPNYSETKDEPVTLPSIFPNLLCNPNTGIGVALACNWLPHNLGEVAQAIYDVMDGKEPSLPGPDFPTGGLIINKNDLPNIIKTGRGSVKIRGKYKVEDNNIVFYEIPYGVGTEDLMNEIGAAADEGKLPGIKNIRNESNRKGFRLVIECEKNAALNKIVGLLFRETSLQTSISYNQVALVNKTPTELGLKDCIDIYINHNIECITKETLFDKSKAESKLEIVEGLLKALEDIDNIVELIKKSASAAAARGSLSSKYGFSEAQAKAIVDMKLGRLAGLEKIEIQNERQELVNLIEKYNLILKDVQSELRKRLESIVSTYGDARRTEIIQIADDTKENKEIAYVEPEKCVVIMTESGLIKRVPSTSFRTQRRNGKGIKTKDDIVSMVIRTNTIDSLMIFTDKGKMYRLLVDNIPIGTNVTKGTPIKSLVQMEANEEPVVIYSIYRDTDAKYVGFVTKNGIFKKTELEEYVKTVRKTGIQAIKIKEGDELVSVFLLKDEDIFIISQKGQGLRLKTDSIAASSKNTVGLKGMSLKEEDHVCAAAPIRDTKDDLAVFSKSGAAKRIPLDLVTIQNRNGKGLKYAKKDEEIASIALLNDTDNVLVCGDKGSICISAKDITQVSARSSSGVYVIKDSNILSTSKV